MPEQFDVLVTEGTPAALMCALDLAAVGLSVVIASEGAGRWPILPQFDPNGTLETMMRDVAVRVSPKQPPVNNLDAVHTPPGETWIERSRDEFVQLPRQSVYGIPTSPLAADVSQLVGTGGAMRAYLDRLLPVLTIGKERSLAKLVRSRVGSAVLSEAVEPIVQHRYGVPAAEVHTGVYAPGLNEALTRSGSLTGAALAQQDRFVAHETRVHPRAGWEALRDALIAKLRVFGATTVEEAATGIAQTPEGEWDAHLGEQEVRVRALIVGADEAAPLPGSDSEDASAMLRLAYEAEIERPAWWPDDATGQVFRRAETSVGALSCRVTSIADSWFAEVRSAPFPTPAVSGLVTIGPDSLDAAGVRDLVSETFELTVNPSERWSVDLHPFTLPRERVEQVEPATVASTLIRARRGSEDFALAKAVAEAREQAIPVRRALTGIAPSTDED